MDSNQSIPTGPTGPTDPETLDNTIAAAIDLPIAEAHHNRPTGSELYIRGGSRSSKIETPWHIAATENSSGSGAFATRDLAEGEVIAVTRRVERVPSRNRTSFELEPGEHYELSTPAPSINHACVPNLKVRDNSHGGLDFITLRKIEKGSQLRTHYGMHEWRSISVTDCTCGSCTCKGRAYGFAELDADSQATLTALGVADHLRELIENTARPPRGLTATFDCPAIDPAFLRTEYGHHENGRNKVRCLLDQLTRVIGMNPHGDPVLDYYPTDGSEREGWTAVQLIETSSITLHLYMAGSAWVSIQSCKPFPVSAAKSWIERRLGVTGIHQSVMEMI